MLVVQHIAYFFSMETVTSTLQTLIRFNKYYLFMNNEPISKYYIAIQVTRNTQCSQILDTKHDVKY